MEHSTKFFIRERTSKRHSVACAPERSAVRISSDSLMKRRRSSTSQHSRTFSKGDTGSGSQAELIRTSSLHKYLQECSFPAVFWQSPECCLKRQLSPSPSLAVGRWHQQCALGDTSQSSWDQTLSLGWPSCQAGALMSQKHRAAGAGTKGGEAAAVWSQGQGRQHSAGLMATRDENETPN